MYWADYRDGAKKAKVHVGFDLNHGIPKKLFLTDGKGDERPFVGKILSLGETAVMDRYYQRHKSFDEWQAEGKHFVCRIKASTKRQEISKNYIKADSKEQIRTYGPDAGRIDYLYPLGHLLPR